MSRISLVRLATYALFAVIALLAQRQRFFIPLSLKYLDEYEIGRTYPTSLPAFTETVLSGSEVLRLAHGQVRKDKYSLDAFQSPFITLDQSEGVLKWRLTWLRKGAAVSGEPLWIAVVVNDKDRTSKLRVLKMPNKAPEPTP